MTIKTFNSRILSFLVLHLAVVRGELEEKFSAPERKELANAAGLLLVRSALVGVNTAHKLDAFVLNGLDRYEVRDSGFDIMKQLGLEVGDSDYTDCGTCYFQFNDCGESAKTKLYAECVEVIDAILARAEGAPGAVVGKPQYKPNTGSLPAYVNQLAFQAAMATILEEQKDFPVDRLPRLEVALTMYAERLKKYQGLGKDGLESAKHAVLREMTDIPELALKAALGVYLRITHG